MEENQSSLKLSADAHSEYEVEIEQRLLVNGKPLVNPVSKIQWIYRVETLTEKTVVSIDTESSEVNNNPAGFENLMDFAKLFNRPTEKLVLELDAYGEITAVLNQKDIFEKWEHLSGNELAPYKNDNSMEGIFVAGYNEFSDTVKSLKTNPLYVFFFDAVYNLNLEISVRHKPNTNFLSKLFQGKLISLKNRQEIIGFDTKAIVKSVYRYFAEDNLELDLADMYQRDYKDIIGAEFDYHFECTSEAEYDFQKGNLINLKAVCLEKANEKLSHETIYTVNRAG